MRSVGKRAIEKEPVSRRKPKRLLGPRAIERRRRKTQFWKRAAAVAVFLALLFSLTLVFKSCNLTSLFKKKTSVAKKPPKAPRIDTLLFIGAKEENGKEKALGLALIILREGDEKVAGWSIPENTFVVVPGYGFEKVSMALGSGVSTVTSTIRNFLGIEIEGFVKLSYEDYEKSVLEMRLQRALEEAERTNLNREEYARFSRQFEKIKPADVNLVPLPAKPIINDKETFLKPEEEEIDRLFALIWGISKEERKADLRVIVLNGSGVPGAAGDAAEKLINNNCRIVQTENADNFDYEKTQIIIYKGAKKWAAKIRKVMGVGEIFRKNIPQDLADITVIVGKDYQAKKEYE